MMALDTGIMPKTGYSSQAKCDYRKMIWRDLSKFADQGGWMVIMPARGCGEIDAAISAGVPRDQIFCFDASAAVIATSEWRKKYPDINFCTASLGDLWGKMQKYGRPISAINMDLCGTVAGECVDEIYDFMHSAQFTKKAGFAVNIAKGREGRTLLRILQSLSVSDWFDCDRMAALFSMIDLHEVIGQNLAVYGISQGQYRENKTPMTWATFSMRRRIHGYQRKSFVDRCIKCIADKNAALFNRTLDREFCAMERFALGAINGLNVDDISKRHAQSMRSKAPFRGGFKP